MKKISTLQELTHFTQQEESLRREVMGAPTTKGLKPSTLDSILAFSKALSVRSSKNVDHIEMVLN